MDNVCLKCNTELAQFLVGMGRDFPRYAFYCPNIECEMCRILMVGVSEDQR